MVNMRVPAVAALVALTACAGSPSPSFPHVWRLQTPTSYASAVPVAPGWLITAKHATRHKMTVDRQPVLEVQHHPTLDLALLRVCAPMEPVPLARRMPKFGERLVAIGWQAGQELQVTDGRASKSLGKMTCPVTQGCSGGAVLNGRGEMVGTIRTVFMWRVLHGKTRKPTEYVVPMPHLSGYTPLDAKVQLWIRQVTDD